MQKERYMVRHIRDFVTRKPVGTMVAVDYGEDYGVIVGVCFCNPKDNFSKKRGIKIAMGRANVGSTITERVPNRQITVPIFDYDNKTVKDYAVCGLQEIFPEILKRFSEKAEKYFNG